MYYTKEYLKRAHREIDTIFRVPVSYTHLDVYKRQEVTITFYAAECGEFQDFGEYTKCRTLEEAYKKYQKYCKTSANIDVYKRQSGNWTAGLNRLNF